MMLFHALARIAEVEFAAIVLESAILGEKLRLFLEDGSYIDVWISHSIAGRFGFHWERRHLDGTIYRYDNFPDIAWHRVETFPRHFHNGSQNQVEAAPFSPDLEQGFREFLLFAEEKLKPRPGGVGQG